MNKLNNLPEFRNQAKAVPLVVGFAIIVLGSFSLVFLKDLREVIGPGFLVGVMLATGVIFALQHQIWAGSCHPLEKMPHSAVVALSLSASFFAGYAAFAWELGLRVTFNAYSDDDLAADIDGVYGIVGAIFAAMMFLLAGLRMSRYLYLKILIAFPLVATCMAAVLVSFNGIEHGSYILYLISKELGWVGAIGCGVFAMCLAWAAPIFLYLWKYRNFKQEVEEVQIDPDYI